MTGPTRPTDAELEAGHARLLADTDFTIAPMPTSEERTPEYLDIKRWVGAATLRLWPLSGHVLRLPKANKEPSK